MNAVPTAEAAKELMEAVGYVDLVIPRGGRRLIDSVRDNSKVPFIETGAGVVHAYMDAAADLAKAAAIVNNAKTRRVSVCNALDCLIVSSARLAGLPELCRPLAASNVEILADGASFAALEGNYPEPLLKHSTEADYGTYRMDIEKTGNCFIATPDKDRGADAWTYAKMQNNDSLINPLLGFDFNTEMAESDIGLDVTLIVKIRELNAEAQAEINDCPDLTSLVELMGGSDAGCFVKKFSPSNGDLPKLTKATNGAYDPEQPAGPEVPNQTPDTSGASPYTIYKTWLTNYGYAAKAVVTD